jgi:hypothetical protein
MIHAPHTEIRPEHDASDTSARTHATADSGRRHRYAQQAVHQLASGGALGASGRSAPQVWSRRPCEEACVRNTAAVSAARGWRLKTLAPARRRWCQRALVWGDAAQATTDREIAARKAACHP